LPVTPFHYPFAYVIYKLGGNLSLPALVVGSMVPDLEIPFMVLLFGNSVQSHLLLHSLRGALTLGTAIAIAITVLLYPKVTSAIFPVDKVKVEEKCRFSAWLIFSCVLGCLSHLLLDFTNHAYNPVFWPFLPLNAAPSPIVSFLGGATNATLLVHALMALLFVGLFVNKRKNFWNQLIVG
jgi:membrane-bound metal-dependent hydrolase YbcI (DUF457 family)